MLVHCKMIVLNLYLSAKQRTTKYYAVCLTEGSCFLGDVIRYHVKLTYGIFNLFKLALTE